MKKINYKRNTAAVLNDLIKKVGLDSYLSELSQERIGIKLLLTISVVIGAASLMFILVKLAILLLSAPYVVYIVIVTVIFCLYLMVKIENHDGYIKPEAPSEKETKT